jgi:sugar phosphate isomerase/epimerase
MTEIGRRLGREDLVASHWTLSGAGIRDPARFSFAERVAAAAAAGFAGIGLMATDAEPHWASGLPHAELRAILDDHGVQLTELEFVDGWAREDERAERARAAEERAYALADALGGRYLNAGDVGRPGDLPPLDAVAERFAALCDRAAAHGLRVAIEFMGWTAIPNLRTAWEIVRRAGRPNGGLLLDAWHYFRDDNPEALRTIPAERIVGVQLDDAEAGFGASYRDGLRRRLPGEGKFELVGLVRRLDEMGVEAPFAVEMIAPEFAALPAAEAARRAHDTTRALLARARGG